MALIGPETQSQLRAWIETFFASMAAQAFGGSAGMAALRTFTSTSAIGRSVEDVAGAVASLEQSFIAGKIAGVIGTEQVRKMTIRQLQAAVQGSVAASLTEADRLVLEQLNENTTRTIRRRAAVREAQVLESVSVANTRWTGALQSGATPTEAAVARRSLLSQLSEQVGFQLAGAGADTKRLMQTELANYFQRGEVQNAAPNEIVYKIPRPSAEAQCMRLHLNPDGSPRRYNLNDVIGNSNIGLAPEQWQFVIGPVHPYCYCILFREEIEKRPGPNKKLAERREETLQSGVLLPTAAGRPSQLVRRNRSKLPEGTTQAVRIGRNVVPVTGAAGTVARETAARVTRFRGRRVTVSPSTANSTEALWKTRTGAWTKERQKLHDTIWARLETGVTQADGRKIYQLTGGGSASGKGTLVRNGKITPPSNGVFIDSDEIKALIPEYQAMTQVNDARAAAFVHAESSFLGDRALARAREKGFNMTLDGTGNGSVSKLKGRLQGPRDAGYFVKADYVYLPTDEAIRRSAQRAIDTGREVPESMIRGTHAKVSQVVPKALDEDLFDEFRLWDNSPVPGVEGFSSKSDLIAEKVKGGPLIVHKPDVWDDFLAKADEVIAP